jgi:hypothetical protein
VIRFLFFFFLLMTSAVRVNAQGGVMTAPQPPDTLTAVISGPVGAPAPQWALALPDTLFFGQPLSLTVEFPPGVAVHSDSIQSLTPWLLVATTGAPVVAETHDLEIRCLRVGPWRLLWDEQTGTDVMWTMSLLAADAAPDPVRDPWRPARDLRLLLLLTLVTVLVLAGLGWLLYRRTRPKLDLEPESCPNPAWMTFASGLRTRIEQGHPATGTTRPYLEDMSRDIRAYLQRRYSMPAAGLTGNDVGHAMASREYPSSRADVFEVVLKDCDRLRFAPEPPSAAVCRSLTVAVINAVAKDRLSGSDPHLHARTVLDAETAWSALLETCRLWQGDAHLESGEVER